MTSVLESPERLEGISPSRVRVPPIVRDLLLLLVGALFALGAEEWRDYRAHVERGELVRASILAELRGNAGRATGRLSRHR